MPIPGASPKTAQKFPLLPCETDKKLLMYHHATPEEISYPHHMLHRNFLPQQSVDQSRYLPLSVLLQSRCPIGCVSGPALSPQGSPSCRSEHNTQDVLHLSPEPHFTSTRSHRALSQSSQHSHFSCFCIEDITVLQSRLFLLQGHDISSTAKHATAK